MQRSGDLSADSEKVSLNRYPKGNRSHEVFLRRNACRCKRQGCRVVNRMPEVQVKMELVLSAISHLPTPHRASVCSANPLEEIGRASCRGGVKISGVGV